MEQTTAGEQAAPRKRQKNGNSSTVIVPVAPAPVALGTLQAATPGALVEQAAAMATALARVIETQKLYNTIQGKRHVRVEGWTTLATMLGVLPREVSVTEEWGVYTATVELVRMSDGAVISRASAECGEEAPWCDRARFARRSMSITRATGKVCRLAFSWIMALAGFEATPSEEMEAALAGQGTGAPGVSRGDAVSPEQLIELRRLINESKANEGRFCAYLRIKRLGDLEASRFEAACQALRRKLGQPS
jgi:hypothetical protein